MFLKYPVVISILAVVIIGVGVAFAAGQLNLPADPVEVTHFGWLAGVIKISP